MSAAMYVLMTEEDFNNATSGGEEVKYLGPDEDSLANSSDFCYHASYVSSIDVCDTLQERIEAADAVTRYLNGCAPGIASVDNNGVICLTADSGLKYAQGKLDLLKKHLSDMTPEKYANGDEYKLRMAIRNQDIFAYPFAYEYETMPVGEYLQTVDAFIHNLYYGKADKNKEEYRFVVTRIMWLHS